VPHDGRDLSRRSCSRAAARASSSRTPA
jgi:hypothetical protein